MTPAAKRSARIAKVNQVKEKASKVQTRKKIKPKTRIKEEDPDPDVIEIPEYPELKIKIVKRGKHPYACRKCEIGFWSKKALDEHSVIHVLKKTKQPNKRFRCDVCAKEFSKLCDMERHTRVHTGEKPCICNICNKGFQQAHNLNKHLLTHLHVKPFHCEICNKQFGRNDVLDRHLLTHSVDKPVKCPLCAKGFIRQTQLNNHMKKNHPDAARIAEVST
ncbi:hypothetical protein NQ315_001095 [Exocentrus adspersus]|uniref:C2H2-type domain-containing protein n=1 Tax=Exocentrus adspersus TaxID=1586481 RepID=A0AAV8WEC7_9CUCU|nr:hypothetical protein NQ315_001095 [Exocentrus adspersus]